MRKIEPPDLVTTLESGYVAVPMEASEAGAALRFCVILREQPDAASGDFVLLRRTPQATIYLGCAADAAGRPCEWLEIWVQNVAGVGGLNPEYLKTLTNARLDAEWQRLVADLRAANPDALFTTGFETQPLPATFIDRQTRASVVLRDANSGAAWTLCRNDDVLQRAGLPSYSLSRARYLFSSAEEGAIFLPVSPEAPATERTKTLADTLPAGAQWTAFNPNGALLLVRRFAPLGLEDFTEVLGGRGWKGVENARKAFRPGGVYRLLEDEDQLRCGVAHLLAGGRGRGGRLAETLHLKLQILAQACGLVRAHLQRSALPLLNLTADSFRVSLGAISLGLPLLWTSRLSLDTPGQAFALPIASSSERHFQTMESLAASIYRPAELALPRSGLGSVRLRKVFPATDAGTVIEGTLSTQERLGVDESELLWLQLPAPGGRVDLYGYRDSSQAMAVGEAVFRTIPQQLSAATIASLQSVAGVPFNQVPFSVLPPMSSPCDLYSLGVLGVRLLLVNARHSLPDALDAMLSLARQVAGEHDPAQPLGARIEQIVEKDARWLAALGPHHLRAEEVSPEEATKRLPMKVWWDALGTLIRFFPGIGPDSFCRGFGDAPSLALESILEKPLHELDALTLRTRAILLLEWSQNLEIAGVIKTLEESYS